MIDALVAKYMRILDIRGEKPIIVVRSNLGVRWLGRDAWSPANPLTTTLELQRSVLAHPETLERVLAHEMIHHRDFLSMPKGDNYRTLRRFIQRDAHGATFKQGAAVVNALMGEGFVTEKSDQAYVTEPSKKEYFLLLVPLQKYYGDANGRIGFAWAARLLPEAREWARKKIAEDGARLVRTTDGSFAYGNAKIRRFGGVNIPKPGSPAEAEIRRLFLEAPSVPV